MAKVGILQVGQPITEQPREHVRKSAAEAMCRQLLLRKIHGRLYQRLAVSAAHKIPAGRTESPTPRRYIPEKLPAPLDARIGVIVQCPVLPNQVRYRSF